MSPHVGLISSRGKFPRLVLFWCDRARVRHTCGAHRIEALFSRWGFCCLWVLPLVGGAAVFVGVHVSFEWWVSWDLGPDGGILDPRLSLSLIVYFLAFGDCQLCFVLPDYLPTYCVGVFFTQGSLLHLLFVDLWGRPTWRVGYDFWLFDIQKMSILQ